jgi:hypothetical protein
MLDGRDVAAFVRVKVGIPDPDDVEACADYHQESAEADAAAFVADLLAA